MAWIFVHTVAPWASRQTVSVAPETASASTAPFGPAASTEVLAGTGGSSSHCCPGPPMVAARPPGSSSHAPPPASVPDAVIVPVTGSGADAVQRGAGSVAVDASGAYAYQPPFHSAVSPAVARTSASPGANRTSGPDTGRLSRCHPPEAV